MLAFWKKAACLNVLTLLFELGVVFSLVQSILAVFLEEESNRYLPLALGLNCVFYKRNRNMKGRYDMRVVAYGKDNTDIIVLLHGGGLSWWNYRKEAELLQQRYHVVLPILDGHADSNCDFISIRQNAEEIIAYIDRQFGGKVLLIGGLSLGGQILVEILAQRKDICRYAIIESALVKPMRLTHRLIRPSIRMSYGLIKKTWFSKLQFQSLKIQKDLYEDYYRDTCKISKNNMISFLEANSDFQIPPALYETSAKEVLK